MTDPTMKAARAEGRTTTRRPSRGARSAARAAAGATNVVAPSTSFVGRAGQLAAVAEALAGGSRVVTIVGPPGIGKTRLALEYAAAQVGPAWPGGVWRCDATAAVDGRGLASAVDAALGGRGRGARSFERRLARRGKLLLVIDDVEHVVGDCARLVARWGALAPDVRFLVTSRERLGAAGEALVELGPLSLPAAGAAGEGEAARLFVERLRAAGGPEPLGGEREAVDELVRALDGNPLAIELAAARGRLVSPRQMLGRLPERFALLGTPGPRAAARHATLWAAIDSSWRRLGAPERSALAQCAAFSGGFTLEAAERVIAFGGEAGEAPPVAEVVAALRDKSLLWGAAGRHGVRLGVHASVREYAARRAPAALLAGARARHAAYYVALARRSVETRLRRGHAAALGPLADERQNLLAVVGDALRGGRASATSAEAALVALHALEPLALAEGPRAELLSDVERASELVEAGRAGAGPRALARLLRGNAYGRRGRVPEGLRDLAGALDLAERAGDATLAAQASTNLGIAHWYDGRPGEAFACCERAVASLRGRGADWLEALALATAGRARLSEGRCEEARGRIEAARALFRRVGDAWGEQLAGGYLALLDQAAGDADRATWRFERVAGAFRALGDARYAHVNLGYGACSAFERGRLDEAAARAADAVAGLKARQVCDFAGLFEATLGAVEARRGNAPAAFAHFDEAALLLEGARPSWRLALEVHRGQVDAMRAAAAGRAGERESERHFRREAERRLRAAEGGADARGAAPASCENVRFAARMLRAALADAAPRAGSLVVGEGGAWFRTPSGAEVSLGRRGALGRLVLALAEARLRSPGVAVPPARLLACGWPAERVLPLAGAARVRVAISALRKLGLAGCLLTAEGGYLLDPGLACDRAP